MPDSIKCSKCDQEFTDEEAHIVHMNIDHGVNEVADSFQFTDSKKPLDEQKFLVSNGVRGYNPNPNAGLYDNKLFRVGSSTERTSILGEALNDDWNLNIDYPFKMSPELATWLRDAGIDVQWRTSMPENVRIHALKQYQSGVSASDYQPYSYESYAVEGGMWQELTSFQEDLIDQWMYSTGSDNANDIPNDLWEELVSDLDGSYNLQIDDVQRYIDYKTGKTDSYESYASESSYDEAVTLARKILIAKDIGLPNSNFFAHNVVDYVWKEGPKDLDIIQIQQAVSQAYRELGRVEESYANEDFTMSENELLDIMRRNQPIRDFSGMLKQEGWNGLEETDVPIQDLISKGKVKYEWGSGYIVTESHANENGGYCNKCGIYTYGSMKSHMEDTHPEVPRKYWKTLEYMGTAIHGDDRFVGNDISQKFYDNRDELEKAMGWARKDDGWSNQSEWKESYASEDFDIRHMEDDALNRKWENTVKLRDMKLNLYYNSGDQKYKEEADQIQSELDLIEAEWQMRDSKESYANEETEYTGGDFCAKCGTEFEDKGECKVCNNGEESSDNYEVDVDEYLKTGEPVQKLPNDKRTYEESYASEEDGTDFDNDGDIDSEDYLEAKDRAIKKSIRDDDDVDYDKEDEQTVGFIEQQHTEPKEDNNKELDDVDISEESIDYVYPTKASEARERSYTTEAKMVEGLEEEYDDFKDSDEEEVTETVTLRKLHGFSNESIARELHITYGVPHEEALEKVHSIEVSTNDKVAQTFFGKMYKECNESEKAELRMYSGSD